jgi:hypothetical protein
MERGEIEQTEERKKWEEKKKINPEKAVRHNPFCER